MKTASFSLPVVGTEVTLCCTEWSELCRRRPLRRPKLCTLSSKAIRKNFQKVREYFVGPEALDLMASGVRLTLDATTPPEFDLNRGQLPSA
jgi:hypothetical protein